MSSSTPITNCKPLKQSGTMQHNLRLCGILLYVPSSISYTSSMIASDCLPEVPNFYP
uniref:Uncharacterized protein n=1 Tax=Oryza brachyantha TaxID=4533 RepID=J3L3L4_ORYBR